MISHNIQLILKSHHGSSISFNFSNQLVQYYAVSVAQPLFFGPHFLAVRCFSRLSVLRHIIESISSIFYNGEYFYSSQLGR